MATPAGIIGIVAMMALLLLGAEASTDGQVDPQVIDRILQLHNDVRAQHDASPLTWDANLATSAQTWTDTCTFAHDASTLQKLGYGENLGLGYETWSLAVKAWTDEVDLYDFSNPGFSDATGHFTQVVWRSTTRVGCANTNDCNGGRMYSCRYFPAGNYLGQFEQNVKP